MSIRIKGMRKTLNSLRKIERYVSPNGGIVSTMAKAVLDFHSFATKVVHVDTGRLKNSLHPKVESSGNMLRGAVETNLDYAEYEFSRSGLKHGTPHNTLVYTHAQRGPAVSQMFANSLRVAISSSVR